MAKLPIIVAPDPRLKARCAPVESVDAQVRQLMDDMLETMYAAPGIGLAAPQVGVTRRVIVVDIANAKTHEPPAPLRMANPRVVIASDDLFEYDEGCLSLPNQFAEVKRPNRVRVLYLDETGAKSEITVEGALSVCVQHEIDHLDGVLFVDHISALKRSMALRKLAKMKRAHDLPTYAEDLAPVPA